MAQTTAVEWFWIHLPEKISKEYFDLFEQAKQIEKEQIVNAYIEGEHQQGFQAEAEEYYNETYNK